MFDLEWYLIFAGIPLAIIVILALLTLKPGANRRPRYKPGQPWNHAPVWYEPHPVHTGGHGPAPAHGPAAVPGGSGTAALGSSMYPEQPAERNTDASGAGSSHGATAHGASAAGASAHGASAHGAPAPAPEPAGPLGGARGTW